MPGRRRVPWVTSGIVSHGAARVRAAWRPVAAVPRRTSHSRRSNVVGSNRLARWGRPRSSVHERGSPGGRGRGPISWTLARAARISCRSLCREPTGGCRSSPSHGRRAVLERLPEAGSPYDRRRRGRVAAAARRPVGPARGERALRVLLSPACYKSDTRTLAGHSAGGSVRCASPRFPRTAHPLSDRPWPSPRLRTPTAS